MPEQTVESSVSGQCVPVTEETLQHAHGLGLEEATNDHATRSMAASALAITPLRNPIHPSRHSTSPLHPSVSPSIRLMPVHATARTFDTANQMPPSPPSTPSSSSEHLTDNDFDWLERKEQTLDQSLGALSFHKEPLPDTPDASPSTVSPADGLVRQQLTLSSRQFVRSVVPNVLALNEKGQGVHAQRAGRYIIEDAGMDLICPGLAGAVLIDTKPTYTAYGTMASSPFSPSTPRLNTGMARSTSTHSNASSTHGVERPSPRRTLLTCIDRAHLDAKDLRVHILDILDHATEKLHADNVIFVLDRTGVERERFRATVHGLCYVGASIIGHGPREEDEQENDGQNHAFHQVKGGDPEESVHAPRCVGQNLVLLSVDT